MKTNTVLEKHRVGEPAVGCFLGLRSTNVAELMGHAVYEWLLIQTEHNGIDSVEVEQMVKAVETTCASRWCAFRRLTAFR